MTSRSFAFVGCLLLLAPHSALARDVVVKVDGRDVHMVIVDPRLNSALPTVVFESGLGDAGTTGWRRVLPLLATDLRVVTYDRPGLGTSEADGKSPTPRHIAIVLHEALAEAGVNPPFVLVGHSLGGARIRMFAGLYPGEIAGLVFVDPTPDFTRTADQPRDVSAPAGRGNPGLDVPRAMRAELEMASAMTNAGFEDFRALPPIGDIPVIVLAGESIAEWPGSKSPSSDVRRSVTQWLQNRNASLHRFADGLTQGTFVATPYSSHAIQNSEPELVAWAIDRAIHASHRH